MVVIMVVGGVKSGSDYCSVMSGSGYNSGGCKEW